MALITCPDCGRAVSDRAPACPHCGAPAPFLETPTAVEQPAAKNPIPAWVLYVVVLACAGALAVALHRDGGKPDLSFVPDRTSRSVDPTHPISPADSLASAELVCRFHVQDKLTTPTEATYSVIQMRRETTSGRGAFVGRGEVTAPNGLGVAITHRFVCLVADFEGAGSAVFRETNQDMYQELIRLGGL